MEYNGKPLMPTKDALDEMHFHSVDLYMVSEILQLGFHIRKRKRGTIEKGVIRGKKITNVVVVELDYYYKIIHVGKFTNTGKFK